MPRPILPLLLPLLLLLLLAAPVVEAQSIGRVTRLTVEHGLSQNTVQAILQDHVGFLWFGTAEGLNRFDGYSFVVYRHQPGAPDSLPHDTISALYEDRRRRLWVGTRDGLSLFDREHETFQRMAGIDQRVSAIAEGLDGTLWVGTEGAGLFEVDPASGVTARHRRDRARPDSLASDAVSALLFDRHGALWVGTRNAGLDLLVRPPADARGRVDADACVFVHHRHDRRNPRSLSDDEVYAVEEDTDGSLWVATYGGGLNVQRPGTTGFRHLRFDPRRRGSLGTDLLTSVVIGPSGRLFVATDGAGVQMYDRATDRFTTLAGHDPADVNSLSQNVVRSLYEDAHGQLWVGTTLGGVNLVEKARKAVEYYTHRVAEPTSLASPVVSGFLEDARGRLWVSTQGGWLHRFDRTTASFVRYRFPQREAPGAAILAMHEDARGDLWVGTFRGGLGRFDPSRGAYVAVYRHRPGDPTSLSHDEVWGIAKSAEGGLWLATGDALDHFMPSLGRVTKRYANIGPEGRTGGRAVLSDRAGNVWLGTIGGLHVLRRGASSLASYHHDPADPHSLSDDDVRTLWEDRDGRTLWIGTAGGGLNRFDPATGVFTAFRQFPSNVVQSVEEDTDGRMWVSTNRGLSRFDPRTGRVDNIDLTDNGLLSKHFRRGSSLRTRAGQLLFGTSDGFHLFDPRALTRETHAPPVVVTSLRIFNQPVRLSPSPAAAGRVDLSYRDKVFSFDFAALDHTLPRRNQYAYRMEGLSDQWIQLGTKRDVTFTNLDPGRYVFNVRASNSDGIWSDTPVTTLTVVVQPPFWGTLWFRSAALCVIGLAVLGAHRARVRHLTADIAERKRAEAALLRAQELQDTLRRSQAMSAMGTLVVDVAHEVRNPLFSISANLEVLDTEIRDQQPCGETLEIIHSEVLRLSKLMEDLLEYGRPFSLQCTEESLHEIAHGAEHACGLLLKEFDVRVRNDIAIDLPRLSVDGRRIAQVFQNLMANAIEHSPRGGVIRLTARETSVDTRRAIECVLTDAGPGFHPDELQHLFKPFFTRRQGGTGLGLSIVQRIVAAHDGTVVAQNGECGGARLIVRLPIARLPAADVADAS